MRRLLIVEDHIPFAQSLRAALEDRMSVDLSHSYDEAIRRIHEKPYDVVLCDYRLNGMNGLELVEQLSRLDARPAVVMMTAFAEKSMAIQALNSGVRHFLEKPFQVKELRAVLDGISQSAPPLPIESVQFCPATNSVIWREEEVRLTPTEYLILSHLVAHEGQWVTRDQVESMLWREAPHLSRNILDTHLYNLRKKVPGLGDQLQVVRGKGFFLKLRG